MLGKCMKYELKAFAKLMLPMLGVFAFTWIIEVVLMNLGFKQGDFVILLLWICFIPMMFLSVIGIPLVCCIFGAKRYNDVFFSKKAYLMRPLPVKGKTLVISIVLNSVCYFCGSNDSCAFGAVLFSGPSPIFNEFRLPAEKPDRG